MAFRYRILERIGAGGIGVVYRAEDLSLKRQVALKFLSEESLSRAHTRARFLREARLAASLNHPSICTVYEVGEASPGEQSNLRGGPEVGAGTPFIVMELVEGRTLEAALLGAGPTGLEDLLKVAVQIVDGLAEAHAKGIVHRDLKPKNVMLTASGRVKILDFGLAKPLTPAEADDLTMKTVETASAELTLEGMVVGTVDYMSPEQAAGRPVDPRSDIFSFGVMLYEMAAGKKPFTGDSASSTMAKILEREPEPLSNLNPQVPLELARIVHRCLRKRPEDRYNDTRDLAVTLRDLLHDTSSEAVRKFERAHVENEPRTVLPVAAVRRSRVALWVLAAVGIAIVATAAAVYVPRLAGRRSAAIGPTFRQVTFTGSASLPALSPDNQYVAYVTGREGGGYRVMVQELAGGQGLEVFQAASVRSLRWSPSGAELMVSGSSAGKDPGTYLVPRLGGVPRPLNHYPFVAWAPDGTRYAGTSLAAKQIWIASTATAESRSIALEGKFLWIYDLDWSSPGGLLAFRTSDENGQHAIWTVTADGGKQQAVVRQASPLYSPRFSAAGDALYYLAEREQARELWKIHVDPTTGRSDETPSLILSGLQAGDHIAFSRDGTRLLYTREMSHSNLWLVQRDSTGAPRTSRLTSGTLRHDAPRFSPDGTLVAFTRGIGSKADIFVQALEDRRMQQLTFLDSETWNPAWSPDGNQIAFGSVQGGTPRLWRVGSRNGTARPFERTNPGRDIAWAPGSRILYQRPGNNNFNSVDSSTEEESPLLDESATSGTDPLQFFSWVFSPAYAPGGDRVAVNCKCPGGAGVWIVSTRTPSRSLAYPDEAALPVGWSADGSWVYMLRPEQREVMRVPPHGGPAETLLYLPFERVDGMDITPDASRIVCSVPESQADVWLVTSFDPEVR